MSLRTTLNFDDGANFTYDSSLIEVTSGVARLKQYANTYSMSETFAAATGFTYESTKAEFVGGVLRQKDQRAAGAVFYASYATSTSCNWATSGTLTGTTSGTVAITSGKLDLTDGGFSNYKRIDYDPVGKVDGALQTGCVRFLITPNYSGAPSTSQYFYQEAKGAADNSNQLEIYHQTDGSLYWAIRSSANGSIVYKYTPWTPVAGTEYEIELNYDITTGLTQIFIDGGKFGVAATGTGTRSNSIAILRIGGYYNDSTAYKANFKMRMLQRFSTVQHTNNYAALFATSPPSDTVYLDTVATLPTYTYTGVGTIQSLSAFTTTETAAPKYNINGKYWSGSAWVTSDGSYAQSTAKADVVANIATLSTTGATTVTVGVALPAGATLNSVDALGLTVNGLTYSTADPSIISKSSTLADDLVDFAATIVAAGTDGIKFQVQVDGVNKWWNGTAWVTSAGTYAEANTAAELNTNVGSIDIATGSTVNPRAVLHSANGLTTPTIAQCIYSYNFYVTRPSDVPTCVVWLFVGDLTGADVTTAKLTCELMTSFAVGNRIIPKGIRTFTADADGRIEAELVQSNTTQLYHFTLHYDDTTTGRAGLVKFVPIAVPAQDSIALTALTTIA